MAPVPGAFETGDALCDFSVPLRRMRGLQGQKSRLRRLWLFLFLHVVGLLGGNRDSERRAFA